MTWAVHVSLAPTWFDPAETPGIGTPFMILYALHDALVKPMPGNAMAPSLAESWSMSKDGLVYEFVLRQGVKFHNGEPVTADDVKFSFERYRGAARGSSRSASPVVEVVDPGRVRFRLKEPWPDFMTYYGSLATGAGWIVPRKYLEKVGDDGFKKAPVGAGPYRFVSFTPGIELVLEAHEQYWRKVPSVKRLVLKAVAGRDHSPGHAQARRGRRRLLCCRARWPRRRSGRPGSRSSPRRSSRPTGSCSSISGTRSRRGRTGGSAWPPITRSIARP